MTSENKGDFSISACSKAKASTNKSNTVYTGSGTDTEGNVLFQSLVLKSIENIMRVRYDPDYDLGIIALNEDTVDTFLFFVPSTSTQTLIPSADNLALYLLKNTALIEGATTEITDTSAVKLANYIANETFNVLRKSAQIIQETNLDELEICDPSSGRYAGCIKTCIFSMHIRIR